jgi:hypothetical protein
LTKATDQDYSSIMNFIIPNEKEIRTAFGEGEEAVVALFGGVTAQVEELAAQRHWFRPLHSAEREKRKVKKTPPLNLP